MIAFLSREVEEALKHYGIPGDVSVYVWECGTVIEVLEGMAPDAVVPVTTTQAMVKAARSNRIGVIVASATNAAELVDLLARSNSPIATIAYLAEPNPEVSSSLRSSGVMEVFSDLTHETLAPLIRRGADYRALLAMELANRCESRRLHNRELEILGQPPESMSDDLSTCQPPPLPVGPMSVFDLEEASESFEKAYIDRVQQLCGSAREAAVHLGVSSATLSRRLRRENSLDGT